MNIDKIKPGLALAAILIVLAALFYPALSGDKMLAPLDITTSMLPPWGDAAEGAKPHNHNPSDAVTQYLPYRMFAETSLREDGYLGWNPFSMGGYSFAGNTMALSASWTMQLHRWLPFKDAWHFGIIAEFLIAGTGMLVFLRNRKLAWAACIIGAVAYMLNAQFIIWIYHRWALSSFCWMPWVLWSLGDGFQKKPLSRRLCLLPIFLALAFTGGTLQHIVFVILACASVALADCGLRNWRQSTRSLVCWAVCGSIALGICTFTLFPQVTAYLTNVEIGHSRGELGYKGGPLQPILNALTIPARIWPWLFGEPQTVDGWKAFKLGFMSLNFMGSIPMILGFAGLFVRSIPRPAKFLVVIGLLIPLTPLVGPLYHRVELLYILGSAWISAELLHQLQRLKAPIRWQRWLLGGVCAVGLALAAVPLIPDRHADKVEQIVVAEVVKKSQDSQFGQDQAWFESRAREWLARLSLFHPRTAWVYGLLVLGAAGLVLAASPVRRRSLTGQWLVLGATTLELGTLFHLWVTFSDPAMLRPADPAIERVRELADNSRVLQTSPHSNFASTFATPNLLASYNIPSLDAYESIQYPSPRRVLSDLPPEKMLPLAGVGLSIHHKNHAPQPGTESWTAYPLNHEYLARKLEHPLPLIACGSGAPPSSSAEIYQRMGNATPVQPELQTPNRLKFSIPPDTAWVRIANNWHQGWKWRADGGPWQAVAKGIDATCWLQLPADAGQLEVRFFPRPAWTQILSLLCLLIPTACLLMFKKTSATPHDAR